MVRRILSAALVTGVFVCGCSDITEFGLVSNSTVHMFSSPDLAPLGTFPCPENARTMAIRGKRIYFACTDGYVRSFSTETQNLLEEVQIGSPSPSGYNNIVYNHLRNSFYITGPTGNIVEVGIPSCNILDDFSVCSSPVILEVTNGDPGYLWVVDGPSNTVNQVHLETNNKCGAKVFAPEWSIRAVEASIYNDSLVVGTSTGFFALTAIGPGVIYKDEIVDEQSYCYAITSLEEDSNFVAVLQKGAGQRIGKLWIYSDSLWVYPPPRFFNDRPASGDIFFLERSDDPDYLLGVSGSFSAGNCNLRSYTTDLVQPYADPVSVPGDILDMDVSDYGVVYVLTY